MDDLIKYIMWNAVVFSLILIAYRINKLEESVLTLIPLLSK